MEHAITFDSKVKVELTGDTVEALYARGKEIAAWLSSKRPSQVSVTIVDRKTPRVVVRSSSWEDARPHLDDLGAELAKSSTEARPAEIKPDPWGTPEALDELQRHLDFAGLDAAPKLWGVPSRLTNVSKEALAEMSAQLSAEIEAAKLQPAPAEELKP